MQPLRHLKKKVTFRFANGAAGDGLVQEQGLPFEGEILHIRQENSSNTGTKTAQLEVVSSGVSTFDGTAKAHNDGYDHEFVTTRRMVGANDFLRCTISGDPGASGYIVSAVISFFGREG